MKTNDTRRRDVKDLNMFKHLVATLGNNLKAKDRDEDPNLSGAAGAFLDSVAWSPDQFALEHSKNFTTMSGYPFKREARFASRIGERLLTMSGLTWNASSQNRARDWVNVATAVTVETALVEHYREQLLTACPGARALRCDLQTLFLANTSPYSTQVKGEAPRTEVKWEFADKIAISVRDEKMVYDAEELNTEFLDVHTKNANGHVNDPVTTMVQHLEKNKYLASSSSSAPPGAVETLAHHFISGLIEVIIFSSVVV
jgi:hypothetical protein